MPAAEAEITVDLVRRLLAAQHPDLAALPVEPLANGWDNTLFRLGDALVARLPRRTLGASIVVNEQRWLPSLAPRLPLPVPAPVRTGAPGEGYPWPWSIVPFLPGTPAADGPPFDAGRAAADLGWALNLAIVFLAWSADNPRLHAVGRRTLAAVLALSLLAGLDAGVGGVEPPVVADLGDVQPGGGEHRLEEPAEGAVLGADVRGVVGRGVARARHNPPPGTPFPRFSPAT